MEIRKLSVVIPVYNERETVRPLLEKVCAVTVPGVELEIIAIDDGSTDGSAVELERAARELPVRVWTAPANLGKGSAVRIGFALATGDVAIVQDADLELDPTQYGSLLEPLQRDAGDVVYGSRFAGGTRPGSWLNYAANKFLVVITNLLFSSSLTDMETCYKVVPIRVLRDLYLRAARFEFEPEITAQILMRGYRIIEVPIRYVPRTAAQGKKIGWVDGVQAIWTLLAQRWRGPGPKKKLDVSRSPADPPATNSPPPP